MNDNIDYNGNGDGDDDGDGGCDGDGDGDGDGDDDSDDDSVTTDVSFRIDYNACVYIQPVACCVTTILR